MLGLKSIGEMQNNGYCHYGCTIDTMFLVVNEFIKLLVHLGDNIK